ncbi:MAG: hypothetical protein HY795_15385 [Desulfovibrio sp.]|nr:hypothetical protein [Desulfovibrio sp.]MBI4958794.1 hypothetical protein [Desulfovibrio sp.]
MEECGVFIVYRYLSEAAANEGKREYERLGLTVSTIHVQTETQCAWDATKPPLVGYGDAWLVIAKK